MSSYRSFHEGQSSAMPNAFDSLCKMQIEYRSLHLAMGSSLVTFSRIILTKRIKVLLTWVHENKRGRIKEEETAYFYADENDPAEGDKMMKQGEENW